MLTDKPRTARTKTVKTKRFPLLIYQRYHQVNSGLSILLILLGLALVGTAVIIRVVHSPLVSGDTGTVLQLGMIIFVFGVARYLLTWLPSRVACVRCTPAGVKIQTPFMPVVFSYKRIADNKPTSLRDVYHPDTQKGMGRKMLQAVWGETVVVVDLKGYPLSKKWLRMFMGPYLLTPKGTGFVFLVKDWMGLNRQIADYTEKWRASRSIPSAQRGFYSGR
jgi:hypothetical protein